MKWTLADRRSRPVIVKVRSSSGTPALQRADDPGEQAEILHAHRVDLGGGVPEVDREPAEPVRPVLLRVEVVEGRGDEVAGAEPFGAAGPSVGPTSSSSASGWSSTSWSTSKLDAMTCSMVTRSPARERASHTSETSASTSYSRRPWRNPRTVSPVARLIWSASPTERRSWSTSWGLPCTVNRISYPS